MLIRLRTVLCGFLLLLATTLCAGAQTILAPGDRIIVAVPSEPAFDAPVSLNAEGRVLLPEVGEVELAGL
mgnify:CR=1 FL=1